MAIGVFGLQVAYKLKRLEIMSLDDTHGWFGGGATPTVVATVDRIDFSNDTGTANIRGPLSSARNQLAATGNSNYGWFGGGNNPQISRVDRIDFSNDSSTASPRGPLSVARYQLAATGNSNYGWFGGGATPTVVATVDRIDFSNDSGTASPRGPLSSAGYGLASTGNSNYGWFGGGAPGPVATVDRIDFSNDSVSASLRGPLSTVRSALSATGNSNYGWFVGGRNTGGGPALSTIDRIDFSNDSAIASIRGLLNAPAGRLTTAATSNSNYGWFGGGSEFTNDYSTVDRIDFSNDSVTTSIRGPLSLGRGRLAATSGQARSSSVRLAKTFGYGWFAGGFPGPVVATVDRIDFSNDSSTASVRGPLVTARRDLAATGNSNYGWFAGGFPGSTATVNRIDFSNDSTTTSPRGLLSLGRSNSAATGNSNYGWFGGGSPVTATVDRIDFSNDSATASPRGPLSSARDGLAATGNSNYGWFGGGIDYAPTPDLYYATVDRIDFSNDSPSALVRGPLSLARHYLTATGNSNYGWFGGGKAGSPPTAVATVERIDFSNDSSTASVRGPLSSARYNFTATGNSNYGWFGGGYPGVAAVATVDRIDFSNDSSTASVRGSLSLARSSSAATSNTPT